MSSQSHATRHFVSEFLKDLHPDLSPAFPTEVIKDEIAVAYGRRGIPKLVDVLALEELPHSERAHALRVFTGLLSTQEEKSEAIALSCAQHLVTLLERGDTSVRNLAAAALGNISNLLNGRMSVVAYGGVEVLTRSLSIVDTARSASAALEEFAKYSDGQASLLESDCKVVEAIVAMIATTTIDLKAKEQGANTLAHVCATDAGITAALAAEVPASVSGLALTVLKEVALAAEESDKRPVYSAGQVSALYACANCLAQIAHHPEGKTAIIDAGGVEPLGKMCGMNDPQVLLRSTQALMGITVEKMGKVPAIEHGHFNLVHLLKHPNQDIADNTRATILNACEHPTAQIRIKGMMAEEEIDFFLGKLAHLPPDYRYDVIIFHKDEYV